MPCTPISARRSFTSSSLNGLMIASTFFMPRKLPTRCFRVVSRTGNRFGSGLLLLSHLRPQAIELAVEIAPLIRSFRVLRVGHDRGPVVLEPAAVLGLEVEVLATHRAELRLGRGDRRVGIRRRPGVGGAGRRLPVILGLGGGAA